MTRPYLPDKFDVILSKVFQGFKRAGITMPYGFNDYLTVARAAEVLGVTPRTLRNWDRSGKLQPARHPLNGYRLYRREDLQALLEVTFRAGKRDAVEADTPTTEGR